jgi:hypothetical protein
MFFAEISNTSLIFDGRVRITITYYDTKINGKDRVVFTASKCKTNLAYPSVGDCIETGILG